MTDRIQEVVTRYKEIAVELLKNPDNPEMLCNQLTLLMARGNRTPAHLALAQRAAALSPNEFIAVFNLGSAQMRAGHYQTSLKTFQGALQLVPEQYRTEALNHIALAWYDLGLTDVAICAYDKIIAEGIANPEIHQNRAIALLCSGDLAEGLFQFECKWHRPPRKPIGQANIPRWMGEPLNGKRIIVHHEQGWGDAIQFSRFLPLIQAGHITFAGPPELTGLLKQNFTVDAWADEDGPFEADYYCSLMSAAGAMRVRYADVTGEPYLSSSTRSLPGRGKLKVGLVWRGSSSYVQDTNRSMQLTDLCPLFDLPGAAFYALQVGEGAAEITQLGLDGFIADLGQGLKDWNDTARSIMAMDVVVSVDTGVAHLVGALGKPLLLFLPYACCWRWQRSKPTTPWYRSAKLFRQTEPLHWEAPVLAAREAIRGML